MNEKEFPQKIDEVLLRIVLFAIIAFFASGAGNQIAEMFSHFEDSRNGSVEEKATTFVCTVKKESESN